MYGTLVTVTGWTYQQISDMSMADCNELFDYWGEWPPQHVLLAARYLDKKTATRSMNINQAEFHQQLTEISGIMGATAEPTPPHLKDMADWADSQINLMHSAQKV